MKVIFKYLKKYWAYVLVIVALLVVQAQGDLTLPSYTSDIVNIGIQQKGVERVAPDVIREESLQQLRMFMTEEEQQLAEENYKRLDRETMDQEEYKEYLTEYPALADGPLYVLDTKEKDTLEQLDQAFTMPSVLAYMMSGDYDASSLTGEGTGTAGTPDLSQADFNTQEGRLAFRAGVEEMYRDLSDTMFSSVGIQYVQKEYEAIGMDLDRLQTSYLLRTGAKMLGFALMIMAVAICVGYLASRVAASVSRDLRSSVFQKVVSFSNAEMDQFSTASLITRSTNDIQQVQMVIVMILRLVLYAPILGIGGVFRVLTTNVSMSWIIAVAVGAIMLLVLVLMKIAMPKFNRMQSLVDRLNLVTREILTGLPVIRAFSREKYEEKRFETANKDLMKNMLFTNRVMTFMMPVMMLIMNGITVLILWVGANGVDMGQVQVGDIMAFITYTMQIVMSFLMLTMISIMLPRAIVSAKRIDQVLNVETVIHDPEQPEKPEKVQGVVTFDHVHFQYPNAKEDVLEDITFTARPGETTAIIGSTGSGKSTLINLIPRFYDITSGSVSIDGVDVRKMSQHELHEMIGLVPQKGVLFSGTIDSNLRFGREDVSQEQIEKAASIAQAMEFIDSKPDRFQTPIAQGGTNVSGGQKQRLSIARAIAKDPKIYIFDDSFSALDYKTDVTLRKALREEVADSTVIIVAQRISTILHAEQIIVLDDGRIAGIGTHQELLASCEAYQQIARSQLSEKELEEGMKGKAVTVNE